jgi:signal transduction histidine kinase
MKTELINNVSHDIKTPFTSIINYVDLLEKPHTPEEEQEYLEVLGRKSQQLKKLIGDLVEMSKASSGSVTVNMEQVDIIRFQMLLCVEKQEQQIIVEENLTLFLLDMLQGRIRK